MKILLVCSGGMSSSLIKSKVNKYAQEKGLDITIDAKGSNEFTDYINGVDVILLGPQVAYQKDVITSQCSIPVEPMDPIDYALGNAEKIVQQAQKLLGR